ncbi:MAG: hypothetical protein J5586_07830 [Clostridia bacterium]|nr:hypothetical protein [Clostridia bacterium]
MKKNLATTESRRAFALFAALLFVLAAVSGGCSGRGIGPAGPTQSPLPSTTPEADPEPVEGGTLRLPMPVNASRSDPLVVNTEEMLYLFSLVYDSLLTVNSAGELEPCLCESWTSEGGGTWLLRLREGVKWHDGSGTLTAEDVVSTYRALTQLEDSYYKYCLSHIVSMQSAGGLFVRVKLNISGIMGLYSLTFPVRRSAELMGTGAYRVERSDDHRIILTVNTDWWDKIPYITRIVFEERDSNTTALASYEAGQLNMVPTDILTAGKYHESGVTDVHDIMTQSMEVLLFNHNRPLFTDIRLRQAVARGINRSRIVTNVYMNRARAADVPIPPDSWLYDSRIAVMNYDPDAALSLIEDAGYTVLSKEGLRFSKSGGHLSIKLLTSATTENTVRSDAANMIASQLETLGFKVEVVTAAHALGDPESEFIKALRKGDWDLALVGFNLGPGNELSSYFDAGGANNFGHISDSRLRLLAQTMLSAAGEEELREASYELQSCFAETLPFLTLYFRLNSIICSSDVRGIDGAREPLLFANEKNWYISR